MQQRDELLELFLGQVAKLLLMAGLKGFVQLAQKRQARFEDADANDAAILRLAIALDQTTLLKFVEHSRDVRCARHQPGSQIERRQRARMGRPKDSQHVVLLRRKIERAEHLFLKQAQAIVRPPKIEERFLLQ